MNASKVKISIKEESDLVSDKTEYFQETGNWRYIIFLPYEGLWKSLMVFIIVLSNMVVTYNLFFYRKYQSWSTTLYYICELLYFLNVVLLLMHRFMIYQKTQIHMPKPIGLLLIDVLTLLPYYEVYYLLESKSKLSNHTYFKDYIRIKVTARLSTVLHFFHNAGNEPGLNHIFLTTMTQLIVLMLYATFVGGLWYNLKDWQGPEMNWTRNLKYHQFNSTSVRDWFMISYSMIGNCFAHNWSGIITAETPVEIVIVSVTMVSGYLFHIMIFFGRLVTHYLKKIGNQFDFSYRLHVLTRILDNWDVGVGTKNNVIEIYNILWERRVGQRVRPALFWTLPKTLQIQCMLDTFWYSIKHTRMFCDLDMSFLRNMVLEMECQYYMPGEYLLRLKEFKTRLVYIVSGVVQILSQEDQQSPVLSFSAGTVLSETSCLLVTQGNVNIRCASYCEIQVLDMRKLAKLLTMYPLVKEELHRRLNDRLQMARKMQHKDLLRLKDREQKRTSIRWIKKQWRNIMIQTKSNKKLSEEKHKHIVPYHVSKYLHLYVLSDDVELKVSAICLKSKCPFIFEPTSGFKMFCDYLVLCAVIVQCLMVPYIAVYERRFTIAQRGFLYMMDVMYLFGLYVELSTAIKVSGRLISNIKELVAYKIKQTNVLIDIVSILPFELFGVMIGLDAHTETLSHLNRVLKIHRLFRWIYLSELNVSTSYMRIRLIKFSLLFVCFLYFLSCFVYLHTCYEKCEKIGWYHYNDRLMIDLRNSTTFTFAPFVSSFDFVASMLLSLTWINCYSYSMKDIIVEYIIVVLGYFLISFCFAQLGACAILQLQAKNEYQEYLKGLKHFLTSRNIASNMRSMMYTVIQCQWHYTDRYEIAGPNGILADLPTNIKNKVLTQRLIRCLKMNPLFIHCDESIIAKIVNLAKINIFPPGAVIIRENTVYKELNFILRGSCKAESAIPTDRYHKARTILSYGDCFPIIETLMEIDTLLEVTSLTFVELVTISYQNLIVHLKSSFSFYKDLEHVLKAHKEDNSVILSRRKGRLPEMVSLVKSEGVGDFFRYETNDFARVSEDKAYFENVFITLGKWKFIKHVFLKYSFLSTGKFYVTWECVRCTISFIHIIYSVFFLKFTITKTFHKYTERFFLCVAFLDCYIRMHTCYYNRNGILITHPLYTAKHYVKTSFLLDLYCVFPFGELNLHHMFGNEYKFHALLFIANFTRPLLFYRIFSGITYIQERSREGRAILFHNIKYILTVFVILGVLAVLLHGISCPYEDNTTVFKCTNSSWLQNQDLIKETHKMHTTTYICYYIVLSIFATSIVSLYKFESKEEIIIILFLTFFLLGVRWFVLAKITSSRIGGNALLIKYQHNMKLFLKYVRRHYIRKNLVNEMVTHYEYIWKRTKGHHSTTVLQSFHSVLRADFTCYLYSTTLKNCEIFVGVEASVLRYLSMHFEEMHFKKDADIIRCNDVINTIFIVNKGLVDITVANDKLCTLSVGGMFGCLKLHGANRQTICAKAKVHVDLLTISSSTLSKVIVNFPTIKRKLKRAMFLNTEYILPIKTMLASSNEYELEDANYGIIKKLEYFLVSTESQWYMVYNYITNVHVATLSSIIIATLISKVGSFDIVAYKYYMYLFDVYFFTKIIIGFHLSYIDPESGLPVTTFSSIWKKYVRSISGFWLDLFTCVPFELLALLAFNRRDDLYRACWINRSFRFIFMLKYYSNCKNTLTVSKHLRWTYLMYTFLLMMHLMVIIWWKIACVGEKCKYVDNIGHEELIFKETNETYMGYMITYQYIVNIFSGTGIRNVTPTTTFELVTTVFMVCVALFAQMSLTIGFASMLLLEKFIMLKYEKETEHVLEFVKATNLSLSLKTKIWKYYVMLWTRCQGSLMPELIKTAPPYLKQDIMAAIFGKYVRNHFLFKKTHVDFIRQLVVHMEPYIFLPGMYIIEKGDIDGCMYFIQEGEVIVYDKHGNNEIEQMILGHGRSFGESQGLYETPHDRSYKARFVCKILVLKKKRWEYLLDWFPASKKWIIQQASRHFGKSAVPLRQIK